MSSAAFPRPAWDVTAYNLPAAAAARSRLYMAQLQQRAAGRVLLAGAAGSEVWCWAADRQRLAYAAIEEARGVLAGLG